jgi:hypothetical protein
VIASEQETRQYPDDTVDGLRLTVPGGNLTGLAVRDRDNRYAQGEGERS